MTAFIRRVTHLYTRPALACAVALTLLTPSLIAQQPAAPAADKTADKATEKAPDARPPLPPDARVDQTMQLDGKTLKYTATVGIIPVYSADGAKKTGEVVYTSYVMDGADRPVTFAFNGGPGASSVYLNFGAIGPKRLAFGSEGDSASEPLTPTDNPGTWLDFTDLVFVDPIGTGFSRALEPEDQAK